MSDGIRQRAAVLKNFSGGLNNFWDASTIAPNEVPYLANLEFSTTGALTSRPPILNTGATYPVSNAHFDILGYYIKADGDQLAVIVSAGKTYVFDLDTTWTKIWDYKASGMVQFKGQLILCRTDGAGAWWTATDGTNTISTMPAAQGLALHKERLFAFGPTGDAENQSRVYWSKVPGEVADNPSWDHRNWASTEDFIDVAGGDGQWITGLVPQQTSIIIFRNASTYAFSYDTLVAETGYVSKYRENLGAENAGCIVQYENNILVLSGDQLYSYYNGNFTSLNDQKVRFEAGSGTYLIDFAVSIIGSRAIVWFKGNTYVYQMKTNTWSMWESTTGLARALQLPPKAGEIADTRLSYGVSGYNTSSVWKLYRIYDHPTGTGTETFTCKLRTKIYDFETPSEWKRLYWWASDVMAANTVTCRAIPVSLDTSQPSWDILNNYTWDQLNAGTWDNPTATPVSVTTVVDVGYTYAQRVNLKLDHSLRFRRIYFEVEVTCDGTAATTPVQIFSLSPMIGAKAKISGEVS